MTCEQVIVQGDESPVPPDDDEKEKDKSSMYIIAGAALLGAYLLLGNRK